MAVEDYPKADQSYLAMGVPCLQEPGPLVPQQLTALLTLVGAAAEAQGYYLDGFTAARYGGITISLNKKEN